MAEKFYTYGHYTPNGSLFYIGKGLKRRVLCKTGRNKHWHHIVAKHGYKAFIFAEWCSEEEAFRHEQFLIAYFKDELGFDLCNYTNGGEGTSGYVMTEEQKSKISVASKNLWENEDYRDKMKTRAKGSFTEAKLKSCRANAEKGRQKLQDPKVKEQSAEKNSEKSVLMWIAPGFRDKMSETHKALWTEEKRKQTSKNILGRIRVTDGVREKNVFPDEAVALFEQGWIRGRGQNSPSKRPKIKN